MENFIVSARKYRPDTFATVIGQSSLTTTLKNAIKNNHLAHAYLFCGPRGVGKTTCARIFAKTINCFNISENHEACNECESCKAFNEFRSYNIHELDAASNNSVEDIRNLIDQVRIPPQVGKYSVYIIDEVHMLSSQAFNAFLKTLEEPPEHAIFILATTEKHKIIPTILSRCQIFDFNRIKVDDISNHLEFVAKSEGITTEPDALTVISQKADGAMRDALSIFDQIVSFAGNNITYKSVIENLNVLDYDYYFKLTNAFKDANVAEAYLAYNTILDKGFDGHNFITGMSEHFRNLLVCKDQVTLQLLEVGAGIRELYKQQSSDVSIDFLYKALKITNRCDLSFKSSKNKRLHVELALLQLCNITSQLSNEIQDQQTIVNPLKKKITDNTKAEPVGVKVIESSVAPSVIIEKNVKAPRKVAPLITPKRGTLSIKNALKGKVLINDKIEKSESGENSVQEDETQYVKVTGEDLFSEEDLILIWKKYTNKIKNDKPRIHNTLVSQLPVLKDNFLIELTLSTHLQEEAINSIKGDLVVFLRQKLNNRKIELKYIFQEIKQEKKKLYSEVDKYKHLATKNPKLIELKDKFKLDFK